MQQARHTNQPQHCKSESLHRQVTLCDHSASRTGAHSQECCASGQTAQPDAHRTLRAKALARQASTSLQQSRCIPPRPLPKTCDNNQNGPICQVPEQAVVKAECCIKRHAQSTLRTHCRQTYRQTTHATGIGTVRPPKAQQHHLVCGSHVRCGRTVKLECRKESWHSTLQKAATRCVMWVEVRPIDGQQLQALPDQLNPKPCGEALHGVYPDKLTKSCMLNGAENMYPRCTTPKSAHKPPKPPINSEC